MPDTITVRLTWHEVHTAAFVGMRRHISALCDGRKEWDGEERGFDVHIIGALGEKAVAKEFNLYWPDNIGTVREPDVGGLIEVKCRRRANGLDLPMRPHFKPEQPHVLIYADTPRFEIVGWIIGQAGWDIATPNGNTGMRFVPYQLLRPVDELRPIIETLCHGLAGVS